MTSYDRRSFGWVALSSMALLLYAPSVAADPPAAKGPPPHASAEIMVLHALQDGDGTIDPRIGNMPQLRKPPFSAYTTYKLVDKKTVVLNKGKPANYVLVNGRTLQVTLVDLTDDKRFRVAAHINQPKKPGEQSSEAFLKLLEVTAAANEPFFVAGQSHAGGILVIGVTLRP